MGGPLEPLSASHPFQNSLFKIFFGGPETLRPQPKGKEEIQKMDEKTAIESFAEVIILLLIIGYFFPDTKRRIDEKKKKDEEPLD